jgi:glycosidase
VLDRAALRRGRDEPEAYSADADWMPSVVLVAKNAYVWLDQLSRWRGQEIHRLDQVPDEALADLRADGFGGLWLIGLWQRSEASARIKRMRGQEDAVASAYSLYDYRIADDLGGYDAWRELRDRAARHGLKLAADMVPNHVGIDGRWVIERPDFFLSLPEPPYPGYAFHGPDLSSDDRVEIRIEDGYWESRDAAVVFERLDRASGERRYVYHGNDGTSMPWNDTAQIDYLNPEAREAVIQVILEVARMFPIIRFDAAMTLAKQHVQRLWYPPPGHGGAIPSRSAYGSMDEDEFERRMPVEFWREVVDRVAAEAPDTLLLAEAFWMMEGYFVRTLGMHRVYNSAFMNMLAREANGDYQQLMRNVLEFDPQILQRFVNFMNNPDEETAIAQFGDGDKAYGVATLMATLPGLPMFGHGQVEGLHEKYGMEYRRAKIDERPNEAMIARHRREVAPLLARRRAFAGTDRFRLFEVTGEHGSLPDVFAYATGEPDGTMNLIQYHNRYAEAQGRIERTVPYAVGGSLRQQPVGEALGLHGGPDRFVRYRDLITGLEHLARSDDWLRHGIPVRLGAYQRRVWLDVVELRDVDGRWERLWRHLEGRGAERLEDALVDLELEPLHQAFAAWVLEGVQEAPEGATSEAMSEDETSTARPAVPPATTGDAPAEPTPSEAPSQRREATSRRDAFVRALRAFAPDLTFDAASVARPAGDASSEATPEDEPNAAWLHAYALTAQGFERPADAARRLRLGAAVARRLVGEHPPYVPAEAWGRLWEALLPLRAVTVEARPLPVAAKDPSVGLDEAASDEPATAAPDDSSSDASQPRPPSEPASEPAAATDPVDRALAALADDEELRALLGVHTHDGVRWFRSEGFRAWRDAWLAVAGIGGADAARREAWRTRLDEAADASGYRFDRLVAPDVPGQPDQPDAPHEPDEPDDRAARPAADDRD